MSRILLDLSPQMPNMNVDTAVERRAGPMTGKIQELDATEDAVWMRHEYRQKFELRCRQRHLSPRDQCRNRKSVSTAQRRPGSSGRSSSQSPFLIFGGHIARARATRAAPMASDVIISTEF
jgi:hypothetical protein